MPNCMTIKKPKRAVCIGDMRDRVTVYVRTATPSRTNGVDLSEVLSTPTSIWAAVVTKEGKEIFDGTNLKGVATHWIYIRSISGLTAEKWLEFNGEYYDIIDVQDMDERGDFMLLRCSVRGTTSNPVNLT